MQDFKGKTAFITGGGAGIGLAMARAFLQEGMKVVVADIRQKHLDETAAALAFARDRVHFIRLDVTDRAAMEAAAAETEKRFGALHLLCNNAGVSNHVRADVATYGDWDWVMGVNVMGVGNGLVAFLPGMKAHGEGGHIVNTGSIASLSPRQGRSTIYTAAKFAILGLSAGLRYNMAPYGIGVSILCPGLTATKISLSEEIRPAAFASDAAHPPRDSEMGAGMDPADVTAKVVAGVRANAPYIMTTAMLLNDEIRAFYDGIIAALPAEEKRWPGQDEYEAKRRAFIARETKKFGDLAGG